MYCCNNLWYCLCTCCNTCGIVYVRVVITCGIVGVPVVITCGIVYVPVVIMSLAAVPAFFLGRRLAGNIGGFFSAFILSMNPMVLSRTIGGFSDTDAYNILFPVLAIWLYVETIHAKQTKYKYLFIVIT